MCVCVQVCAERITRDAIAYVPGLELRAWGAGPRADCPAPGLTRPIETPVYHLASRVASRSLALASLDFWGLVSTCQVQLTNLKVKVNKPGATDAVELRCLLLRLPFEP